MNHPTNMQPIDLIDYLAHNYTNTREVLSERVAKFEAEVQAVRNRLLPGIKTAAAAAADIQGDLSAEISRNPELFTKPRTMTLHGIRLGFAKGKGKITWGDEDKVVAAIRRHFARDMADTLIRTVEQPVKDALQQLPAVELRKLGVQVEEAGDHVYIKAADSEVDKLVAQILKECAEVIQVIGKILRHGYDSRHPDGGPTNRSLLALELGHVEAAEQMLCAVHDVSRQDVVDSRLTKLNRVWKYLHHAS